MLRALAVSAVAVGAAASIGTPGPGTRVAGCPVLPATNAFNRDISTAPVDPRSDAYVRSIGLDARLHPDFASKTYGIPFKVVAKSQKRVPIHFTDYGDESDRGPTRSRPSAPVEGGSDRHVIVLQRGTCMLYELFGAQRRPGNGWNAASGAMFDLRSGKPRPKGWTSADAAGLPIFPGLARCRRGRRRQGRSPMRCASPCRARRRPTCRPRAHFASGDSRPATCRRWACACASRRRFDLSRFHGQALVILKALKRYGMIVADNGSSWYITRRSGPSLERRQPAHAWASSRIRVRSCAKRAIGPRIGRIVAAVS